MVWDKLANAFLDHFFSKEFQGEKVEEFVNLKQ